MAVGRVFGSDLEELLLGAACPPHPLLCLVPLRWPFKSFIVRDDGCACF